MTANNADARLSSLQHRPTVRTFNNKNKILSMHICMVILNVHLLIHCFKMQKMIIQKKHSSSKIKMKIYQKLMDMDRAVVVVHSPIQKAKARKPTPLAPTLTICLVRMDWTTIWCAKNTVFNVLCFSQPTSFKMQSIHSFCTYLYYIV